MGIDQYHLGREDSVQMVMGERPESWIQKGAGQTQPPDINQFARDFGPDARQPGPCHGRRGRAAADQGGDNQADPVDDAPWPRNQRG